MTNKDNTANIKQGKSFYIAVAVCFAATVLSVGGVFYKAEKNKTNNHTTDGISLPLAEYTTNEQKADATKNDVADERTTQKPVTQTQSQTTAESKVAATTGETERTTVPNREFVMPLGTDMIKDYSEKAPVYSKTMNDWRIHTGIDFAGKEGAEVVSISNGTVKKVYADEKWGTVVQIAYGVDLLVNYCGLEQGTTVKTGDVVSQGECIGCLGDIPCETLDGAHLHFETVVDGEYSDPLEVLGKAESTFAD